MFRLFATCLLITLCACATTATLPEEMAGKWRMAGIRIFENDASPTLNPMNNRWISFSPAGTFRSGSGDETENAGTFSFSAEEARLDLDSDAGPGDDSSWRLTLRHDSLFMRGIGTERQNNSELVLVRSHD